MKCDNCGRERGDEYEDESKCKVDRGVVGRQWAALDCERALVATLRAQIATGAARESQLRGALDESHGALLRECQKRNLAVAREIAIGHALKVLWEFVGKYCGDWRLDSKRRAVANVVDAALSNPSPAAAAMVAVVEKAKLPRNTSIVNAAGLSGEWVAVPAEDFIALRDALSRLETT